MHSRHRAITHGSELIILKTLDIYVDIMLAFWSQRSP